MGWGGVGLEWSWGGVVCWMVTAFLHNVVKFYTGETMYTRYTLPHNKDTHHSVSDIFCIHEAVRLFPHLLLVYKVHRCSPNLGDTHIPKHMHRVHQAAIHTLPTSTPPSTAPHPAPPQQYPVATHSALTASNTGSEECRDSPRTNLNPKDLACSTQASSMRVAVSSSPGRALQADMM